MEREGLEWGPCGPCHVAGPARLVWLGLGYRLCLQVILTRQAIRSGASMSCSRLQKSIAVNNWWQSSRYAQTAARQDAPELMEPTSMWKALLAHVDQNTSQVQGDKRIDLAMSQVQTCKTAVAQRYRMSYKTSMAEHVHLMELKGRWQVFLACARRPHNTPISPKCILALADWIALAAVGRAVWNAAPEGQHKHVHCFVALHRECIQKIKWMTPIIRFPDALAMGGSSLRLLHALADQDVSLLHHRQHATAGLLWMALATRLKCGSCKHACAASVGQPSR